MVEGSFQEMITLVSSDEVVVGAAGESGAEAAIGVRIEWVVESAPEPTEFLAETLNW